VSVQALLEGTSRAPFAQRVVDETLRFFNSTRG
jgi:hypothetical protein